MAERILDPPSAAPGPRSPRAAALLPLLAALAVLGSVGGRLLAASEERFVVSFANDDSFYFFQLARNAARGLGPSFDGLEWTNGVTPVWAALLVPLFALVENGGLAARLACLAALVLYLVALLALRPLLARRFGPWPAALAVCATVVAEPLRRVAVTGMDFGCNLALQVAVVFLFVRLARRPASGSGALLTGVVAGLLCIQRPDTALLPVLLTLPLLVELRGGRPSLREGGPSRGARLLVGAVLVGASYLVACQLAFGSPLTVSGKIKTHNAVAQLERGNWDGVVEALEHAAAGPPVEPTLAILGGELWRASRLGRTPRHLLLAALVALAFAEATATLRRRRAGAPPPEGIPVGALHLHAVVHTGAVALLLFPYVHYGSWYASPQALAGALLAAAASAVVARLLPTRFRPAAVVLATLALFAGFARAELAAWRAGPPPDDRLEVVALRVAEHLRVELPREARIGSFNAGRVAFYTDGHVVNLDGLINTDEFAESVWLSDQGGFGARFLRYALAKELEWFVDVWLDDDEIGIVKRHFTPRVRQYFSLVESWPTRTTHTTDDPGAYQLVRLDLERLRADAEEVGGR